MVRPFGRRRADRERVRDVLTLSQSNMPPGVIASEYAEEIVRLRRQIRKAVNQLQADRPDIALHTLRESLAERWW